MPFVRLSTLCNSLAFHLNPGILESLNPGVTPAQPKLSAYFALVDYNYSEKEPKITD